MAPGLTTVDAIPLRHGNRHGTGNPMIPPTAPPMTTDNTETRHHVRTQYQAGLHQAGLRSPTRAQERQAGVLPGRRALRFSLCVTPAGKKTFYFVKWVQGRGKVRIPLGRLGDITVEQAKKQAEALLGDKAKGIDIVAERREAREPAHSGIDTGRFMDVLPGEPRKAAQAIVV